MWMNEYISLVWGPEIESAEGVSWNLAGSQRLGLPLACFMPMDFGVAGSVFKSSEKY